MIFANLYLGQVHIKQWESPAKLWMSLFCRVQETEGQKNRFQSRNIFMFQTTEKRCTYFRKSIIIFYPITLQCHRNNLFPPLIWFHLQAQSCPLLNIAWPPFLLSIYPFLFLLLDQGQEFFMFLICLVGWLVVLGLTVFQFISGRLPERGRKKEKWQMTVKMSKQPHPHLLQ